MLLDLIYCVFFDHLMLDVCILLRSKVNYFDGNGAKDTDNCFSVGHGHGLKEQTRTL